MKSKNNIIIELYFIIIINNSWFIDYMKMINYKWIIPYNKNK